MQRLGEILKGEVLVDGLDVVVRAELEHVLHFSNRADIGASHCDLVGDHVFGVDLVVCITVGSAKHHVDSAGLGQSLMQFVKHRILDV